MTRWERESDKRPKIPLGIEDVGGVSIPSRVLNWAESVRVRERLAAAERREAEYQHLLDQHNRGVQQRGEAEAAAAAAADVDAERKARVDAWAEKAMASIARERYKETQPTRLAWARAGNKVESSRKLVLGGLLTAVQDRDVGEVAERVK